MTWWEFTAMRAVWNDRHRTDDDSDEPFEMPDLEYVRERGKVLEARGISRSVH